jgi:hypothetical protein
MRNANFFRSADPAAAKTKTSAPWPASPLICATSALRNVLHFDAALRKM